MPLTKYERKEKLGYGAVKDIAIATGRSEGHVSQVLSGKRTDKKVEVFVARRLQLSVAEAFPEYHAVKAAV